MPSISIQLPAVEADQQVEVEVKINGKKKTYHYRVEIFAWEQCHERSARYLRLGTLRFALRARLYMRFIIYFQIESSHKFRAGEFENPRWRSAGWHWNRYVPSETIGSFHREKIARRGFVFDG